MHTLHLPRHGERHTIKHLPTIPRFNSLDRVSINNVLKECVNICILEHISWSDLHHSLCFWTVLNIYIFFQPPSALKCDAQFARLVSAAIYHLYYTPQLAIHLHPNAIPHLILHSQCLYHFNVWPLKTIRVLQSESEKKYINNENEMSNK